MECCLADPVGQHGTVQIKARAREDLALTIQGKVIGILADQNMGDGRLGRQATHDQMAGCWGLGHPVGAGPASILRAHGDDHAQLGRHDVQPLAAVFADLVHDTAATGAGQAGWFDDLFDARQRGGQVADGAFWCRPGCPVVRLGGTGFLFCLNLGQRD